MEFERASGILLHPTSLPSPFGIGDLGESAYAFVHFLIDSGQSLWQVLPLGVTGYGDSPYQSFSSFAGNPLMVSPTKLVNDGLLDAEAIAEDPGFPAHEVDYGPVISYKNALLKQSYEYFQANATAVQQDAYTNFCQEHKAWLDDFAFFMALKQHHADQDGGVWNTWPEAIAMRQPAGIKKWQKKLADQIEFQKYQQFLFFSQWLELKAYANERGIKIVGDIPIFVAFDSADVWANRELFYLDDEGNATVIAGVPPDYFSETGQRWGNPLYRWDRMADNGYAWWANRLRMCFTQADIVRIDHFRGFEAYWEIPASEETAVVGEWVKGPGQHFFDAMQEQLGDLPLIAEDLGVITEEVEALRDRYNFPGMKILQFGFGGERNNAFLPHTYTPNCVVYTGTHDNETTLGWYQNASYNEQDHVRRYIGVSGENIVWDLIRLAMRSVANMAVFPMQDLLNLDNHARMNFPGKVGGYWRWRFLWDTMDPNIKHRLHELTTLYGRLPEQ